MKNMSADPTLLPDAYESEEETEEQTFERLVKLRRQQCQVLDSRILRHLILVLEGDPALATDLLVDGIERAYRIKMRIAASEKYPPKQRRSAYNRINKFHQDVDEWYEKEVAVNRPPSAGPLAGMAIGSPPKARRSPANPSALALPSNQLQVIGAQFESLRTQKVGTCRVMLQGLVAQGNPSAQQLLETLKQHDTNASLMSLTGEQMWSVIQLLKNNPQAEKVQLEATAALAAFEEQSRTISNQTQNTAQPPRVSQAAVQPATAQPASQPTQTRTQAAPPTAAPAAQKPNNGSQATQSRSPQFPPLSQNPLQARTTATSSQQPQKAAAQYSTPALSVAGHQYPGSPTGGWHCAKCTYFHQYPASHCVMCETARAKNAPSTQSASGTEASQTGTQTARPLATGGPAQPNQPTAASAQPHQTHQNAVRPALSNQSTTASTGAPLVCNSSAPAGQQQKATSAQLSTIQQQRTDTSRGNARADSAPPAAAAAPPRPPSATDNNRNHGRAERSTSSSATTAAAAPTRDSRSGPVRLAAPNPGSYVALAKNTTPSGLLRRENSVGSATSAASGMSGSLERPKALTQDDLMYELQRSLSVAKPHIRSHVQEVAKKNNIPRSKEKFINYAKSALRLNKRMALEVWTHIEMVIRKAEMERKKAQNPPGANGMGRARSASANQSHPSGAPAPASVSNTSQNQHLNQRGNATLTTSRTLPESINQGSTHRRASDSNILIANPHAHGKEDAARRSNSEILARRENGQVSTSTRTDQINQVSLGKAAQTQNGRAKRDRSHIAVPASTHYSTRENVEFDVLGDPSHNSYACAYTKREHPVEVPLRRQIKVQFDSKPVPETVGQSVADRLSDWEPFWEVVSYVKIFQTNPVSSPNNMVAARSAFWARLEMANPTLFEKKVVGKDDIRDWGKARAEGDYSAGETRLLVMMIPRDPPAKKADGHLWPKGTFFQLRALKNDHREVERLRLKQRKQESHDEALWKGMSAVFDLTQHINDPKRAAIIEGITYDADQYIGCVVYARYRPATRICLSLLNPDSPDAIATLSEEEGKKKVIVFASSTMVSLLDSDDENEAADGEAGKFIFSLTDAYSGALMTTPVRGVDCKHFQCFDLTNFVSGNAFPHGNRWRCLVCEKFLSWQGLERCGFTAKMLGEFSDLACRDHDRIEVTSNGSYRLLNERGRRNKKRKAPPEQSGPSRAHKMAKAVDESEVVDLL